jgi:hypothetical protein
VWVDQDANDVSNFEVNYAVRSTVGGLTTPKLFGKQGSSTWTPSVVRGMIAVWNEGGLGIGPLFVASSASPPASLLAPEQGSACSLARETSGALDLAWSDDQTPRKIRYARSP